MGSKSAPPPPQPDPAIAQAAKAQAQLGQDYLNFAKEQFAFSQGLQEQQQAIAKEVTDTFMSMAKEDRERWQTLFKPLEDDFVKTATEFDTPERRAEAAAKAKADVQTAAAGERAAIERRQASMGVSPDSGRYAGIDRAMGLGSTLASVDAQNRARNEVRDTGLALKAQAIGLGRNLPAQAGTAMTSALNASGVPIQTHAASTGIVQPGYSAAITGQQGYANTLNSLYGNQLKAYNSDMSYRGANAQGIGQFAGQLAGIGLSFLSSKQAKTNRKDLPAGKALEAVEQMPVQTYNYKEGVADGGAQEHVGVMAEDFHQATGKGDGRTIPAQDLVGLAIGAVQDLSRKVDHLAEAIGLGSHAKPAAA